MPVFHLRKQGSHVEESWRCLWCACARFLRTLYGTLKFKKKSQSACFASSTRSEILCEGGLSRSWKCKTDASASACAATERDGRRCQAKIIFIRREGSYEVIAPSSGKGVTLVQAPYLCRLPSPPDCHFILDMKNRQKLINTSVSKDAHTCSLQTREKGKESVLSGQVSVLSLSYLPTATHRPTWAGTIAAQRRASSSAPFGELISRAAWIALFSPAPGVQPIFISSLKEGKAEPS